jgi:hypothetical protein
LIKTSPEKSAGDDAFPYERSDRGLDTFNHRPARPGTKAHAAAAEPARERGSYDAQQARIVRLLLGRVDVQEDALEVRIRAEGLVSLVAELRQSDAQMARAA